MEEFSLKNPLNHFFYIKRNDNGSNDVVYNRHCLEDFIMIICKSTVSLFQDSVALFETSLLHLQIWSLLSFIFFSFRVIRAKKNSDNSKTCSRMALRPKRKYTSVPEHDALLEAKNMKIFLKIDLLKEIRIIFPPRTVIVMEEIINMPAEAIFWRCSVKKRCS